MSGFRVHRESQVSTLSDPFVFFLSVTILLLIGLVLLFLCLSVMSQTVSGPPKTSQGLLLGSPSLGSIR